MRLLLTLPLAILLVLVGCGGDEPATSLDSVDASLSTSKREVAPSGPSLEVAGRHTMGAGHFVAILSKDDAGTTSRGRGTASFAMSDDGTSMSYRLVLANLENVTMAHIHIAAPGSNGAIAVWLYPDAPPASLVEGRVDGVLAEGTIEAEDLMGPLEGMTLMDLVDQIEMGMAYVNVHTEQYPSGEIRGQVDRPMGRRP